jgi:Sigma-70 factor, region 1.1
MTEDDVRAALLEYAVKSGVVIFEELYEAFPPAYCDLEDFQDFVTLLEDLGVKVVEAREDMRQRVRRKRAA